jgi:hypothetical protein
MAAEEGGEENGAGCDAVWIGDVCVVEKLEA